MGRARDWRHGAGSGTCPDTQGTSPPPPGKVSPTGPSPGDSIHLMVAPTGEAGGRPLSLGLWDKVLHSNESPTPSTPRAEMPGPPLSTPVGTRAAGCTERGCAGCVLPCPPQEEPFWEGRASQGRPLAPWPCPQLSPPFLPGPGPAQAGAAVPDPGGVVQRRAAAPRRLRGALPQVARAGGSGQPRLGWAGAAGRSLQPGGST